MKFLEIASSSLAGLSTVLFLGFMSHPIPSMWSLIVILSIVGIMILTINGVSQASAAPYYLRRQIAISFLLRGLVAIGGLLAIAAIGAWFYVPPVEVLL